MRSVCCSGSDRTERFTELRSSKSLVRYAFAVNLSRAANRDDVIAFSTRLNPCVPLVISGKTVPGQVVPSCRYQYCRPRPSGEVLDDGEFFE